MKFRLKFFSSVVKYSTIRSTSQCSASTPADVNFFLNPNIISSIRSITAWFLILIFSFPLSFFFIISEADTLWLVLMYLDLPFCVIRIFTLYVPSSFRWCGSTKNLNVAIIVRCKTFVKKIVHKSTSKRYFICTCLDYLISWKNLIV